MLTKLWLAALSRLIIEDAKLFYSNLPHGDRFKDVAKKKIMQIIMG